MVWLLRKDHTLEMPTTSRFPRIPVLIMTSLVWAATLLAENIMIHEDNMKELRCSLPNDRFRLAGSNAIGQLFVGDEPVDLKLAFKKGDLNGKVSFALEIQEVGTRTPGKV